MPVIKKYGIIDILNNFNNFYFETMDEGIRDYQQIPVSGSSFVTQTTHEKELISFVPYSLVSLPAYSLSFLSPFSTPVSTILYLRKSCQNDVSSRWGRKPLWVGCT